MEMNCEGNRDGLIMALAWYFPGGTEEDHDKPHQDSQCPSQDLTQAPLEYGSELLLCQHAQF
jgi:hypothetical protein